MGVRVDQRMLHLDLSNLNCFTAKMKSFFWSQWFYYSPRIIVLKIWSILNIQPMFDIHSHRHSFPKVYSWTLVFDYRPQGVHRVCTYAGTYTGTCVRTLVHTGMYTGAYCLCSQLQQLQLPLMPVSREISSRHLHKNACDQVHLLWHRGKRRADPSPPACRQLWLWGWENPAIEIAD